MAVDMSQKCQRDLSTIRHNHKERKKFSTILEFFLQETQWKHVYTHSNFAESIIFFEVSVLECRPVWRISEYLSIG